MFGQLLPFSIFWIWFATLAAAMATAPGRRTTPQPTNINAQMITDLQSGRRNLLGLGIAKARFIVLIDNSPRDPSPSNIYVYSPSLSEVSLQSTPPQIPLINGAPLSVRYPAVYKALQGSTVRNRTIVISDDKDSYLLFAFDSNSSSRPVLYSINEDKVISHFKGAANLQKMLDLKFQVFTMISASTPMKFYSLTKYFFQPEYVGLNPAGNKVRCIFEIDAFTFNGSSIQPKNDGSRLDHVYFKSSLCKDKTEKSVSVSKDCHFTQCLGWDIMAGFADERYIYLVGRDTIHAVENVFSGRNVAKQKLSVMSFKMTDFFIPEKIPIRPTLPPSTIILIGVVCLILLIALTAITFWLCMKKNLFYDAGSVQPVTVVTGGQSGCRPGATSSSRRQRNCRRSPSKSRRKTSHSRGRSMSRRYSKKKPKSRSRKSGGGSRQSRKK